MQKKELHGSCGVSSIRELFLLSLVKGTEGKVRESELLGKKLKQFSRLERKPYLSQLEEAHFRKHTTQREAPTPAKEHSLFSIRDFVRASTLAEL